VIDKSADSVRALLTMLGFPVGVLAILGSFCIGLSAYRNEVALNSKTFVLGAFLFSLSCLMSYLARIYPVIGLNPDTLKEVRSFGIGSTAPIVGAILLGTLTLYFGRILWGLLH
jgi:hypothetical protein